MKTTSKKSSTKMAYEAEKQSFSAKPSIEEGKAHEKELKSTELKKEENLRNVTKELSENKKVIEEIENFQKDSLIAQQIVNDTFEEIKEIFWRKISERAAGKNQEFGQIFKISSEFDHIPTKKAFEKRIKDFELSDKDKLSYATINSRFDDIKTDIIDAFICDSHTTQDMRDLKEAKQNVKTLKLKKEKLERDEQIADSMAKMF